MKARSSFPLAAKMYLFFLVPPIITVALGGYFFWLKINDFSRTIIDRSSVAVRQMAEDFIAQKAQVVAAECRLYLENHPEFQKETFDQNPTFKAIAVKKVGKTGYTGLYELAEVDGGCRTWAHINPKLIGVDMRKLESSLGGNFPDFWRIWSGAARDKDAKGYYNWKDADGKIRAKYAVCTAIPNTNFAIGATTYLDEFTEPMKEVESKSKKIVTQTKRLIFSIIIATLLLMSLSIYVISRRLSSRIRSLTDAANRISTGNLEIQINDSGDDEIGQLSQAITRMQDSISLSLARFKRRETR